MPRHRPPYDIWQSIRRKVWLRDGKKCKHCGKILELNKCHIDHIESGKLSGNRLCELRTLCRRCHVTRIDFRHRGMIAVALRDGIIPIHWRKLLWEDWYIICGTVRTGGVRNGLAGRGKARHGKVELFQDIFLHLSPHFWWNFYKYRTIKSFFLIIIILMAVVHHFGMFAKHIRDKAIFLKKEVFSSSVSKRSSVRFPGILMVSFPKKILCFYL